MTRTDVSDDAGFTLIELLVAMIAAVVVLFGLTTILIVTLHQTQRTFTQLDASARGRTAMADIENELHSACVGGGQAPIQAGSTGTSLQFLSYYGAAATPTPVWHVLTYNATAHTLTDASYTVTGGAPTWAQGTQTASDQLLTNVTQRTNSSGTPTPVFQYYAFQAGSSDAGGTYWVLPDGTTTDPGTGQTVTNAPLSVVSGGLTTTHAQQTVEVVVNLSVGASSEDLNSQTLTTDNDQVDDAISLRLTTPPDEVPSTTTVPLGSIPSGYGPCE